MRFDKPSRRAGQYFERFVKSQQGSVVTIFAILLIPILAAVGGAVDYSNANSVRTDMQKTLDTAALNMIRTAADIPAGDLAALATSNFTANFNRPNAKNLKVTASYDSSSGVLVLNSSAEVKTTFMSTVGFQNITVSTESKAKLGGSRLWHVCVLVTHPDDGHTLMVKDNSSIDFKNCMVQVNTENWDAVEARDTSYIHSVDGVNCFTGDIHYGDVKPPKEPTCTMLPDPYESFKLPSGAGSCTYNGLKVNTAGTTLSPGTYCGNLEISADVNFKPGVYFIKDGAFKVQNAKVINATGVTFVLTGKNAGLDIDMSKYGGTFNITPATGSAAGQYAGFLFFLDQSPSSKYDSESELAGVTMKSNGIIYLRGQKLKLTDGSNITLDTGSIIADYIVPEASKLTLAGTVNSPETALGMKKTTESKTPMLVQ